MFEASFKTFLESDTALTALLSEYNSTPSIFTSIAPQDAETPYIIFDIERNSGTPLPVAAFDIYIHIFHDSESSAVVRSIANEIELYCDTQEIKSDSKFSMLRFYMEDGREVENPDITLKHYFVRLSARAGRKEFIERITT